MIVSVFTENGIARNQDQSTIVPQDTHRTGGHEYAPLVYCSHDDKSRAAALGGNSTATQYLRLDKIAIFRWQYFVPVIYSHEHEGRADPHDEPDATGLRITVRGN